MMNPHGFVMVIEQDGSRWYEAAEVDAFITELEGDCADWAAGAERYARRSRDDYLCLRAACRALSECSGAYDDMPVAGIIASLRDACGVPG